MNTIEELAQCVNCSREEFAQVFEQIRQRSHVETEPFMMHVMQVRVGDDVEAFTRALRVAEKDGWLPGLLKKLMVFRYLTIATGTGTSTELQNFVNKQSGFQDPSQIRTALPKRMSQVCLLEIEDGKAMGSGFLVGPNAVLTSWHVIHSLLDASGKPKPGSEKQIKVRFDHIAKSGKQLVCHVFKDKWLLHHSPCHPSELNQQDGVTTTNFSNEDLLNHLDFAIIALASCPGNERGFVELASATLPKVGSPGYVLQHPEAFEQQIAQGDFEGFRPGTGQQRLLYGINTLKGSSGGMIVDSEFNFVGLHQGAFPTAIDGEAMNTGISGKAICEMAGPDHLPDPSTMLQFRRFDNSGPIIGRKACQEWIQQCRAGEKRIVRVYAAKDNQGTSFSCDIMSACLPDTENRIVRISAGQLPLTSEKVADFLLKKLGVAEAELPDPNTAETADPDWIKTRLIPVFRDRVNEKCADMLHWLVIDNIDKEPLPDTGVRRFLDVLYSDIANFPNLRIVLIGLKEKLKGVNAQLEHDEEVNDPTLEDISRYIRLRYTDSQIDFDFNGGEIKRLAGLVERSASTVIKSLDEYVQNKVDDMIDDTVAER